METDLHEGKIIYDGEIQIQNLEKQKLFLFIGILSKGNYTARREAQRNSWVKQANSGKFQTLAKFILAQSEFDANLKREKEQNGDILIADQIGGDSYRSIFSKTIFVFRYAVEQLDVRFIFKTDDDAFVFVPGLIQQLQQLCKSPSCQNERLYIGQLKVEAIVNTEPGHQWNDEVYKNYSHLEYYPPYMLGGGYALSSDLAQVLVNLHKQRLMFETPIEDATIGLWLLPFNYTRIDMHTFLTTSLNCCKSKRNLSNFQKIQSYSDWRQKALIFPVAIRRRICPSDRKMQLVVIHKVEDLGKMEVLADLFESCRYVDELHKIYYRIEDQEPQESDKDTQ